MNTNEDEVITQENDTEQDDYTAEVAEQEDEEVAEESIEDLKKKLATTIAQKEHWRNKASSVKEAHVANSNESNALSSSDLLAVMKANIHEDDMERVEKFAKMESISIKDALKNPELKAMLDLREEQRTTASATNVTTARRGSIKITDDVLLSKAASGSLPEDDDGINRLIAAKLKSK